MTTATLTWDELARLEPRLQELLDEARAIKDDKSKPTFCANDIFFIESAPGKDGFKMRLIELVGWSREHYMYVEKGLLPTSEQENANWADAEEKRTGVRPSFRVWSMSEMADAKDAEDAIMAANPIVEPPENAVLHTSEAYDLAYETIFDALPNCRNCLCS